MVVISKQSPRVKRLLHKGLSMERQNCRPVLHMKEQSCTSVPHMEQHNTRAINFLSRRQCFQVEGSAYGEQLVKLAN